MLATFRSAWMVGLGIAVGCGHHRTPTPPTPDTVSPPVSLDEFRSAFPAETTLLVRYTHDGETHEERWTWTRVDDVGCTIAGLTCDLDGNVVTDDGEATVTWAELMSHATFPADHTVRSDASIDVMAGHYDTWLYVVEETAEDGTPTTSRFHFARTQPGPPVLMTVEQGGTELLRMELVERHVGPLPEQSRCTGGLATQP